MSTFGSPPMPMRFDDMMTHMMTINASTPGAGAGGVGINTYAQLYTQIPCSFQVMSSNVAQRYKSLTEETLYEVYFATVAMDGTDITVEGARSAWQFVIDGVKYAALSGGVEVYGSEQRVGLRRMGTV